jgi:hypothetical protein
LLVTPASTDDPSANADTNELRKAASGDDRVTAELGSPTERAIAEANAAITKMYGVTPEQEHAQAYVATVAQVFASVH